jgi:AbrB family looped-hinge helix DNA binding protein
MSQRARHDFWAMAQAPHLPRLLKLGPQGRVVIPVELRRELGYEDGDDLVAWIEDGHLAIRTREQV